MDSLPADKKYYVDELFEKARSQVEQITKNKVGESAAKTIKRMLYERLEHMPGRPWYDIIHQVTLLYNFENVHRTIDFVAPHFGVPRDIRRRASQGTPGSQPG